MGRPANADLESTVVVARMVVTVNGEASQQEFEVVDLSVQPGFCSVDNVGVIDSYRCAEGGNFIS